MGKKAATSITIVLLASTYPCKNPQRPLPSTPSQSKSIEEALPRSHGSNPGLKTQLQVRSRNTSLWSQWHVFTRLLERVSPNFLLVDIFNKSAVDSTQHLVVPSTHSTIIIAPVRKAKHVEIQPLLISIYMKDNRKYNLVQY